METWQAIILGLVEGITEYLPVSSTGHLIIAKSLMGLDQTPEMKRAVDDFIIIIQGGAIMAVVGLYWRRMVQMVKGLLGRDPKGLRLFVNLVVAFIPAAALGKLLDDWIEARLFFVGPVTLALALGGVYMIVLDQRRKGRIGATEYHRVLKEIDDVTPGDAFGVGLLQCVAMWPGMSRSMMTITGGYLVGLRPRAAAEFSFLVGLPTLTAATLYKLYKNVSHAEETGTANVFETLGVQTALIGIGVAAVSAALAVWWLVGFLNRRGLTPFGWYRIVLAVVLGVLVWRGVVEVGDSTGPTVTGTELVPPVQMDGE